jgi:hypothetical protein
MCVDGGARAEREPGRRGGDSKVRVYGSQDRRGASRLCGPGGRSGCADGREGGIAPMTAEEL